AEPVPHASVEDQRESNPDPGPRQRFTHADDMRSSMKYSDVEREHRDDERNETAPKEQGLIHQRLLLNTVRESGWKHCRVGTVFLPCTRSIALVSRSVRL